MGARLGELSLDLREGGDFKPEVVSNLNSERICESMRASLARAWRKTSRIACAVAGRSFWLSEQARCKASDTGMGKLRSISCKGRNGSGCALRVSIARETASGGI